jgi:hypothetical protein
LPKAAEYWSYVRECEDWAKRVRDEDDRQVFFAMAKAWAELATKEQGIIKNTPMSRAVGAVAGEAHR